MNQHVENLKQKGIAPSYQRVRILEFVRSCRAADFFPEEELPALFGPDSERDYHPSAEQIHAHLVKDIPTLSKTTVYNTLKLFEGHRLISSVMIDQHGSHGALRYDRYAAAHAHLLCNSCRELLDWPLPQALSQQLDDVAQDNSDLQSWQLILRGDCPACRLQHSA